MDNKEYNKELFIVEAVIGVMSTIMALIMVAIAAFLMETQTTISVSIMIITLIFFVTVCLALTKMEQIVGYYKCTRCHHKHVPSYNSVLWSMHFGRMRYMNCPKCHKRSWQKKVLQ